MTIRLVMKRTGHQNFERMIEVWNWCEKNFGKPDYYKRTWNGDFADYSEDWVEFTFYDDTMGFWAQNRFPDMITHEQWVYRE